MDSSSDDHENDNSLEVSMPQQQKRLRRGVMVEKNKRRLQRYRPDWEKEPNFIMWLSEDPENTYKARCNVCDVSMVSEKHVITKHSEGRKHIQNMSLLQGTENELDYFTASTSMTREPSTTELARIADTKLAAFFVEHNIACNVSDHLGKLLKECIPDSKVIKEMKFTQKQNAKINYKAIAPSYKGNLAKKHDTSKFSVMSEEFRDISTTKPSCVVVRYLDEDVGEIRSKFWNLHNLISADDLNEANEGATADVIYNKLIESFTHHNIPLKNIIGFGSNECDLILGSENSVASRFKEECPGIIIMKCTFHSINLHPKNS